MNENDLKLWKVPAWHADFGDPVVEFEMLTTFCQKLLSVTSKYSFKLDTYEEGYMNVDIYKVNGEKYGELMIVDEDGVKKYGFFYDLENNEKEAYFDSVDEGLNYFPK